jgi:hypothetical protein
VISRIKEEKNPSQQAQMSPSTQELQHLVEAVQSKPV